MSRNHNAAGGAPASRNDDWATPKVFFDVLDSIFKFDLDACASANNAKCKKFYTKQDDALRRAWDNDGKRIFCNPPYSLKEAFLECAIDAASSGALVVCLVPAATDAAWFHNYARKAETWILKGRVQFERPDESDKRSSNTKGSALMIFGSGNAGVVRLVDLIDEMIDENLLVCGVHDRVAKKLDREGIKWYSKATVGA